MTTFEMLQELLAQNEFELLLPEDHTANTTEQDIRLVYQMNDTVESFLVFREAIFTGTYKKDYEGKLDASYDRDQDRYGFRDMKICVSWNFGLQCCGTSIPIWGKITAVRGKSAWSIWRMSRRLISALTVLHRSRIWCHMRCRKGLSCRAWM